MMTEHTNLALLDRRRGPGRPTGPRGSTNARDGELSDEQFTWILAIDNYRRTNNVAFPTWTEVLDLLKYLGYRCVAETGEFPLNPPPCDRSRQRI